MKTFFAIVASLLGLTVFLRLAGFAPPTIPDPETTPGAAVERIAGAAARLDMQPFWDNTPATWKADADTILEALKASANPELWELGFNLIVNVGQLCASNDAAANGIDNSQRLAAYLGLQNATDAPTQIKRWRLRVAATLQTIAGSGLEDPDNLTYLNLRELSHGFLPEVERKLRSFEGQAEASLMEPGFEAAILKLADDGAAAPADQTLFECSWIGGLYDNERNAELRLVQVEGCWIDERSLAVLPAKLASAKSQITSWTGAADSPASMHLASLLRISSDAFEGADGLAASATDPVQFDAAFDRAMGALLGEIAGHKMRSMFR